MIASNRGPKEITMTLGALACGGQPACLRWDFGSVNLAPMSLAEPTNVAAIAGRRIDAPTTEVARFPAELAPAVKAAAKRLFSDRGIGFVVASAACGADILALEGAIELGIRIRVVLPFDRQRFRSTSVVDRGQDWGPRYDAILAAADAGGGVVVLEAGAGGDDAAYGRATVRIIDDARALALERRSRSIAIAIWDEQPRHSGDATKDFLDRASVAGLEVVSISTTRPRP